VDGFANALPLRKKKKFCPPRRTRKREREREREGEREKGRVIKEKREKKRYLVLRAHALRIVISVIRVFSRS